MSANDPSSRPTQIALRAEATRGAQLPWAILVCLCIAQLITVVISWPAWQVRASPPNLPVASSLPDLPFGWLVVASLVFAVVRPKVGVPTHIGVLIAACLFDQFRMEPQFFGLAIMMVACVGDAGKRFVRWFLAAMWFWAGLHKMLSPDWLGHVSFSLVEQAGLDPQPLYLAFAWIVAITEMVLGILALVRPRWAAPVAVAVHFGIVLFMSPFFAGMNDSVIPWNLAVAGVGYWVLSSAARDQSDTQVATPLWEKAVIAVLLIMPAGFYLGWVDRSLCHVLYSDHLPRGMVTDENGFRRVRGWQGLGVPFPSERRLYRCFFQRTAKMGDKLHISDPRPWLDDQFFVMRDGGCLEIDADEFFALRPGEMPGVALDRKRSVFALSQSGVQMKRESKQSMIYAVAFTPENFDRSLLKQLAGLPNLMQIQLAGTDVQDDDLKHLKPLRMLIGLGLSHTSVTDDGLRQLSELPYLDYVETEGTSIIEYGSE